MSLHGILRYLSRALALALPATALLYCLRRMRMQRRGQVPDNRREPLVLAFYLYFLSLIAITAIRDGAHLAGFWRIPHDTSTLQLIPIVVTLQQGRAGAWYLISPIAGNVLSFLPFGFLLGLLRPSLRLWQAAVCALVLSLSIEVCQWVLLSGISDIDDVIFNLLGGVLGRCLAYPLQPNKK